MLLVPRRSIVLVFLRLLPCPWPPSPWWPST